MSEKSFFVWDAGKFSVSVSSMDQEHQQLISIMNRLHEKNQAKATKPELMAILKELATYTVKHFKDEEAYFDKLPNYPHAAAHKKVHQDLLNKVTEGMDKFDKGTAQWIDDSFFQFLKTWLAAHMAGVDRKYGTPEASKKAS